jgi:uncharacterized protein DUF4350
MSRERRTWIVIGGIVGAFVLVNVVVALVSRYTSNPGGPTSSSYATAPEGLAAYFDLLASAGHSVTRVREDLAKADLDTGSTLVVLDPRRSDLAAAVALRTFVEGGGRLIAGGAEELRLILLDRPPVWTERGSRQNAVLAPVPEVAGVSSVVSAGEGSWESAGEALPVVGSDGRTLAVVATVGRGRVALLADASPLQNRLLGQADDAAFGLALAGQRNRPVQFVESVHGYGRASGIAAIPTSWRWALGGLVLAALVLVWARGRRLGPPERTARDLPPPRRLYVDSLAALLARSKRPRQAIAPVQAAVRERIRDATRLPEDADEASLRAAGAGLGLGEDELTAVLGEPRTPAEVVAAGRALARLEGGRRR